MIRGRLVGGAPDSMLGRLTGGYIYEHRSCGWPDTSTGQLDNNVTLIRGGGHGKEDLEVGASEDPGGRSRSRAQHSNRPLLGLGCRRYDDLRVGSPQSPQRENRQVLAEYRRYRSTLALQEYGGTYGEYVR